VISVAIVTGSTRPGRNNEAVARWVFELATERSDADFELVDIAEYGLPLLDEPLPPSLGKYTHAHTRRWAAKIASFDAYVFVTPEYNHGIPAALKNAIDYLFLEWNNKAAGFVSYAGTGGVRAVAHGRGRALAGEALDVHGLRELRGVQARSGSHQGTERDAGSGNCLGHCTEECQVQGRERRSLSGVGL